MKILNKLRLFLRLYERYTFYNGKLAPATLEEWAQFQNENCIIATNDFLCGPDDNNDYKKIVTVTTKFVGLRNNIFSITAYGINSSPIILYICNSYKKAIGCHFKAIFKLMKLHLPYFNIDDMLDIL